MISFKDQLLVERERLESEHPDWGQSDIEDAAIIATENYFDGYSDYCHDKAKDERMMEDEN